jgi:hypothetical protein
MARSYSVVFDNIAAQNSTTVPQAQLVATAAVRPKLYDLMLGSPSTPSDQAASWVLRRSTTASTGGTAVTPAPIDPGDPVSITTAMIAPSMSAPTLTAGATLLQWAQNLRATFRWVAAPGKEIVAPATAANGLTLLNSVLTGAFNVSGVLEFEE